MPKNAAAAEKLPQSPSAPQVRNANWVRQGGVAIGCAALFAVFPVMTSNFYQPANLLDIMLQSSINAIIAVGMTLVVMTKGTDLSVGSVVGISSMIAASLLETSLWLGVGAGLVAGLCRGLINGVLIAKLKLPDFKLVSRQVSRTSPTDDVETIFRAARSALEKSHVESRAVRLIGVGLSGLEHPAPDLQLALFD